MCAVYGFGGGRGMLSLHGLLPMAKQEHRDLISDWMEECGGNARITGVRARNLNPIIRVDESGLRAVELSWWWLWQNASGPAPFSAFNARDDKLLGRAWAAPFQHRAVLPASWYVEKGRRFELPQGEAFGIAAITNDVMDRAGDDRLTSYAMVTRAAVGEAAEAWHRMPLVLPPELHEAWLDPSRRGDAELIAQVVRLSEEICAAMELVESEVAGDPPAPTLF